MLYPMDNTKRGWIEQGHIYLFSYNNYDIWALGKNGRLDDVYICIFIYDIDSRYKYAYTFKEHTPEQQISNMIQNRFKNNTFVEQVEKYGWNQHD